MKEFRLNQLLYVVVVVVLSIFLLSTCKDDDPWDRKNRLETSTVSLTFNAVDTFRTVYIASDLDFTLDITGSWIHAARGTNKRGMDSLVITVDDYSIKTKDRYDTIIVSSGVAKAKRIVIRQNYLRDLLTLTPDSVSFEAGIRGTIEVDIDTDAENGWIFNNVSQSGWIKLGKSPDGTKLEITVDEFWYGSSQRSAEISVQTIPTLTGLASTTVFLPITQEVTPTELTVTPEAISFLTNEMSTKAVSINTDAEGWDFEYAKDENDWLTLVKSADGTKLEITVTKLWDGGGTNKERIVYITIISGSARSTLRVTQDVTVP